MVKVIEVVLLLLWAEELKSVMLHLVLVIDHLRIANYNIIFIISRLHPAKHSHVPFKAQNLLLLNFPNLVILE